MIHPSTKARIMADADFIYNGTCNAAYIAGAEAEALRSQKLVEALRFFTKRGILYIPQVRKGFLAIAQQALKEYEAAE